MLVTVLYFAGVRDLVGKPLEQLELAKDVQTLDRLLQELSLRHPSLCGKLAGVRLAVNEEFVPLTTVLKPADVVALIPPTAGG